MSGTSEVVTVRKLGEPRQEFEKRLLESAKSRARFRHLQESGREDEEFRRLLKVAADDVEASRLEMELYATLLAREMSFTVADFRTDMENLAPRQLEFIGNHRPGCTYWPSPILRGGKRNPYEMRSSEPWHEAFALCRDLGRPIRVRIGGEVYKVFPSGLAHDAKGNAVEG